MCSLFQKRSNHLLTIVTRRIPRNMKLWSLVLPPVQRVFTSGICHWVRAGFVSPRCHYEEAYTTADPAVLRPTRKCVSHNRLTERSVQVHWSISVSACSWANWFSDGENEYKDATTAVLFSFSLAISDFNLHISRRHHLDSRCEWSLDGWVSGPLTRFNFLEREREFLCALFREIKLRPSLFGFQVIAEVQVLFWLQSKV